jgi:hypothetical protein
VIPTTSSWSCMVILGPLLRTRVSPVIRTWVLNGPRGVRLVDVRLGAIRMVSVDDHPGPPTDKVRGG